LRQGFFLQISNKTIYVPGNSTEENTTRSFEKIVGKNKYGY
jgi:hypothetical protein